VHRWIRDLNDQRKSRDLILNDNLPSPLTMVICGLEFGLPPPLFAPGIVNVKGVVALSASA